VIGVELEQQLRLGLSDVAKDQPDSENAFPHQSSSVRVGESRQVVNRACAAQKTPQGEEGMRGGGERGKRGPNQVATDETQIEHGWAHGRPDFTTAGRAEKQLEFPDEPAEKAGELATAAYRSGNSQPVPLPGGRRCGLA
jgi:hypothetical protein